MKVSELIRLLEGLPPELDILVANRDSFPEKFDEPAVEIVNVAFISFYGKVICVRENGVDGYNKVGKDRVVIIW